MILWVIVTGEFPPSRGGVSDYTRLLAEELVECGDEVEVWCQPAAAQIGRKGLRVNPLPDHFGVQGRRELSRRVSKLPSNARVLLQYVPQAYGRKGMNVSFAFWFWRLRGRCSIDVMFHEVATPWSGVFAPKAIRRNLLALVTRIMAALVARSAENIYVSIPAWGDLLKPHVPEGQRIVWLPVPSNLPEHVDVTSVKLLVQCVKEQTCAESIVGHFSTYEAHIARGLEVALPSILDRSSTAVVLAGRGSELFAEGFLARWPQFRKSIFVAGSLSATGIAEHLSACDCLLQPYVDGISSRRGSAMAGLALGRPIVTTFGLLSEAIWQEHDVVCLVKSFDQLSAAIFTLLDDPAKRARIGSAARDLYQDRFRINRTAAILRSNV